MSHQTGSTLLLVFIAFNLAFCFAVALSSNGDRLVKRFVLPMILLNLLSLCLVLGMNKIPETVATANVAVLQPADVAPLVAAAVPPTIVPPSIVDEEMKFGGIMIMNPTKQNFSIMVLNENGEYEKWAMVNGHNEEVKSSWDEKYSLPAEDDESNFEGKVVSNEKEYPFSFDSEVDHRSIKVLNI